VFWVAEGLSLTRRTRRRAASEAHELPVLNLQEAQRLCSAGAGAALVFDRHVPAAAAVPIQIPVAQDDAAVQDDASLAAAHLTDAIARRDVGVARGKRGEGSGIQSLIRVTHCFVF